MYEKFTVITDQLNKSFFIDEVIYIRFKIRKNTLLQMKTEILMFYFTGTLSSANPNFY